MALPLRQPRQRLARSDRLRRPLPGAMERLDGRLPRHPRAGSGWARARCRVAGVGAVNVLFVARHFTYSGNFDSVIEALGTRAAISCTSPLTAKRAALGGRELLERLAASNRPGDGRRNTDSASGAATAECPRRCGSGSTTSATPIRGSRRCRKSGARLRLHARLFVLALARLPMRAPAHPHPRSIEAAVPRQTRCGRFVAPTGRT